MTELRQRMLEELQRRNFAPSTIRYYVRTVRDFAAYFHKPPDQLAPKNFASSNCTCCEIKADDRKCRESNDRSPFLFQEGSQAAQSRTIRHATDQGTEEASRCSSPEEVEKLIAAAPNLRYRMILVLLYATGLRRAEASRVKISDIDSQRMVIHVHEGKNSRDRELPLTPKLLEALRAYWRACKVKPKVYLFPTRCKTAGEEQPVTDKAVWHACRAGLSKRLGPHTLRRTFATHLIESGTDLPTLQLLMEHQKLQDTTLYVHLSRRHLHAAANPLERIHIPGLPQTPLDPAENGSRGAAAV